MSGTPFRSRRDGGSATVAAVGVVAAVAAAGLATAAAGSVTVAAARAQGVADAAALAGAHAARDARATGAHAAPPACVSARSVADRSGVELVSCAVTDRGDVTIVVAVRTVAGAVERAARAGSR